MNKYLITLLLALPFIAVSCSDDNDPVDITVRLNRLHYHIPKTVYGTV